MLNGLWQAFNTLRLSTRLLVVFLAALIAVIALNDLVIARQYKTAAIHAMVREAETLTASADEAQKHLSALHKRNAFDVDRLHIDLQQRKALGESYKESVAFLATPIVHGIGVASDIAKRTDVDLDVLALHARSPEHQVQPESFQGILLGDLTAQVASDSNETLHRVDADTNELHFMRAIRLSESCLACHGDPATSPTGDGKDILGFPMENLKVGDVYAAYHVTMPLAPVRAQVLSFMGQGLLWTLPLATGAVLLIVMLMRTLFCRPIAALSERVHQIAYGDGDLTQRIEVAREDELGKLAGNVNHFIDAIHNIVCQVRRSTTGVAAAAAQIAASSEQISTGIDQQVHQVDEITASIQEMSASVTDVATKASDAATEAQRSGEAARDGGKLVQQTIAGIGGIRSAVNESAKSVEQLGRRGEEIGQVIKVINDIADQTNLLALNAAIEAARAGEHGRGFAVVAGEVRKLADRTTKATEEVSESIKAIQQETTHAVERMKTGTASVEEGVELAGHAGESLETIVNTAQHVAGMIHAIAAAAEEQSVASDQIGSSVRQIAEVTRQSNEGAAQAVQAATDLSRLAEGLQLLVGHFRVHEAER